MQGETVYVNQWFTVRNGEIGSKHVYAGATRIATQMVMGQGAGTRSVSGTHSANDPKALNGLGFGLTSGQGGIPPGILQGQGLANRSAMANLKASNTTRNPWLQALAAGTATTAGTKFLYFYHPDHLGSTSLVTDSAGKPYEHIQYFATGETWVQDATNTQRTPYLFTGKELDEETGLYYFGARYYDARASRWVSTDPAFDSYLPDGIKATGLNGLGGVYNPLNLSTYAYAHHSPIVRHDPDGRFVKLITTGFKIAMKGGDLYSTVSGIVENGRVLMDPNASIGQKALAAVDIALDVGTGINIKDMKAGIRAAEKVADKVHEARGAARTCSFAGETVVLTERGLVPIRELKAGDVVWAQADDGSGRQEWQRVLTAYSTLHDDAMQVLMVDPATGRTETLLSTAEHPFQVEGKGWVRVDRLQAGDLMPTAKHGLMRIASVQPTPHELVAFNLTVQNYPTYFVGQSGVWVHNTCALPPKGSASKQAGKEAEQTAAATRVENVAKGIPESQLGPSGKPKIHVVDHGGKRKEAKDAARSEVGSGGSTTNHTSPTVGKDHYHGETQSGDKSRVHHEYD